MMQEIVFTLCSNNYLAHAKTLGASLRKADPDFKFIIGLVDEFDPEIDYTSFENAEVIPFGSIGFPFFNDMLTRYDVIEFNTAVKPFYCSYLFKRYGSSARILYLDPDIFVYNSLGKLFEMLDGSDILLTPNIYKITAGVNPGELASLRHGKFNLGFIGLKYSENTLRFLDWWKSRLETHCLIQKGQGLFVDQKWVDLAPLFFDRIQLVREPGYNMAWWNLHERTLMKAEGRYFVNDLDQILYFFHFSGYRPGSSFITGRNNDSNDHAFERYPELRGLFEDYTKRLGENHFATISSVNPSLSFRMEKPVGKGRALRFLKKMLRRWSAL